MSERNEQKILANLGLCARAGKLIFGEVTFTNGAGFDPITPREFDLEMGSWLQLPKEGV